MKLFILLIVSTRGIRDIVWDTFNQGSVNRLSQVSDVAALQVWSADTVGSADRTHSFPSDAGWQTVDFNQTANCTGVLRFGSTVNNVYSMPIVTNQEVQCDLPTLRSYLWRDSSVDESQSNSGCQCQRRVPLRLTMRGKCLAAQQVGWIGPGLVDCLDAPNLIGEWKYHPFTGQLRYKGQCLTAYPFNKQDSSGSWKPWGVQMSDCLSYQSLSKRQAWDLPEGVGMYQPDVMGFSVKDPSTPIPSGYLGRVVLRDSADIGTRCVDISMHPPQIPTSTPVIFLEAILCDDVRLTRKDQALWRFWIAPNATPPTDSWDMCTDGECSVCDRDDQFRSFWTNVANSPITDPVSLPNEETFSQSKNCSMNILREFAIEPRLASVPNATCFCQEIPTVDTLHSPLPGTIIWGGSDDIPKNNTGSMS